MSFLLILLEPHTFRMIISLWLYDSLEYLSNRCEICFLNGLFEEEMCFEQPESFTGGTERVYWSKKILDGLKQALKHDVLALFRIFLRVTFILWLYVDNFSFLLSTTWAGNEAKWLQLTFRY